MNQGQFKDPLCYMCLCGTVVSFLSLTQEVAGSNTAIVFIFDEKLSLNSRNSVKTFRENSVVLAKTSPMYTCFLQMDCGCFSYHEYNCYFNI